MAKAVIFDFNRTLFNPETGQLFPDALACLNNLPEGVSAGLITNTSAGRNKNLFRRLGIANYFSFIQIVDQKELSHFQQFCQQFQLDPSDVYIVGDLFEEEIAFGQQLGMKTIWLQRNRMSGVRRQTTDYTVSSLSYVPQILERGTHVGS